MNRVLVECMAFKLTQKGNKNDGRYHEGTDMQPDFSFGGLTPSEDQPSILMSIDNSGGIVNVI